MESPVDVAIVGGGFAGSVLAARLLADRPGRPMAIALVERHMPPGRGVAYGTPDAAHRLNIPAGEMSAFGEDPGHFVRWLRSRGEAADEATFAPRGLYGAYVAAVLDEARASAAPGRSLELVPDEAVGLLPAGEGYQLRLASGRLMRARAVVLAVGQFPPVRLRLGEGRQWYVEDPWSPEAIAPLGGSHQALLIGTGLTAVDVALTLLERAGAARVTMVSRRAQLPAATRLGPPYRDWLDPASAPVRVSELWHRVRAEVAQARATGVDWRAVIDAMKPHVPALWARLPLVERRRFLRHARSYWEAHRNRLPPPTAERIAALMAAGRLRVVAGRVRGVEAFEAEAIAAIALRGGGHERLAVARVVNCTGPDTQFRQINHPLILDVIGTGLGRPDPLGLGLDVAPDGRLKDEDWMPTPGLYTLGWPRIGQLWEATTVPSLREQARDLAARLLG